MLNGSKYCHGYDIGVYHYIYADFAFALQNNASFGRNIVYADPVI